MLGARLRPFALGGRWTSAGPKRAAIQTGTELELQMTLLLPSPPPPPPETDGIGGQSCQSRAGWLLLVSNVGGDLAAAIIN